MERVGMVVGITVGLGSLYIMWCNRREKSEKMEESKFAEKPQPAPKLTEKENKEYIIKQCYSYSWTNYP
jgi:hypothetical protein